MHSLTRFTNDGSSSHVRGRVVAVSALCALLLVAAALLVGCSTKADSGELESDTGLTGGIAAKVNGTEIEEDKVTRAINNMRLSYRMDDDEQWKQYLQMTSNTPESIRYTVLEQFVDQELVKQCADQLDITTDDDEIQSYIDQTASNYSSEAAWKEALEEAGYENGEDDYRDKLEFDILNQKLEEKYSGEAEDYLSDEANFLTAAQEAMTTYSGAKKTSRILFDAGDEATAQQVYQQISSGALSFEDAVAQYSTDTATKSSGGDMGWDKLSRTLSTEYTQAIADLANGSVSEPVSDTSGVSIIKVTDEWTAPETLTSESQIPSELLEQIRNSATSTEANDRYESWLASLRAENEIEVNPMPSNVPYNVDMSDVFSQEQIDEINEKAKTKLIDGVEAEAEDVTAAEAEGDAAAEDASAGEDAEAGEASEAADSDEAAAEEEASDQG